MTEEEKIGRSGRMIGFIEEKSAVVAPNNAAVESWKKGGCPLVISRMDDNQGAIAAKAQCGIQNS